MSCTFPVFFLRRPDCLRGEANRCEGSVESVLEIDPPSSSLKCFVYIESLLVVRDLGVQLERWYLSGLVESVVSEMLLSCLQRLHYVDLNVSLYVSMEHEVSREGPY
jgi:hypothetical protein